MRLFVAGFVLLSMVTESAFAQVRSFPYKAVIDADSVFARSGPGQKFYATSRLSRSDQVVVHRHDPGGWYMIAPPAGSFSWIRADAVNRLSRQRGVLTDNNVAVRVGSTLDDKRDVFQARLSTGAAVEIIGEKTIQTEQGAVRMFKIAPPKGEWRWIPGRAVTPADQIARSQYDSDPYSIPPSARRHTKQETVVGVPIGTGKDSGPVFQLRPSKSETKVDRPVARTVDTKAVRHRGPTTDVLIRDRDRLKKLDNRFRTIIAAETATWDFTQLKQDYFTLQESASHPAFAFASQVALRLSTMQRYEQIKADYDGFIQLTSETIRRDAELYALQQAQLQEANTGTPRQPTTQSKSTQPTLVIPQQPVAAETVPQSVRPEFTAPVTQQPQVPAAPQLPPLPPEPKINLQSGVIQQPSPAQPPVQLLAPVSPAVGQPNLAPPAGPQLIQTRRQAKLKGAGIIQRAVSADPRAPQHVLLDTNGRILAYLQGGASVDLNRYLGHSMGINGSRIHRPDLQMNVFLVESLSPIQLRR